MLRWIDRISPVFLAIITVFALQRSPTLALSVVTAGALHEGGHYLALRLLGATPGGFCLAPWGARMRWEGKLSYPGELAAVLAGPAVNLLLGMVLARAAAWKGCDIVYLYSGSHLALGSYNLLPITVLDGGRAVELTVSWLLSPEIAAWICRFLTVFTLTALSAFTLWLWRQSGANGQLAAAVAGLWILSLREGF